MEAFIKKYIESKVENLPTIKDVYLVAIRHNLMEAKNIKTLKRWDGTEEDKILWCEYVDWWLCPTTLREELSEIINELKDRNPYPESVFIPISAEKIKAVVKLLKDNGYSSDSLYGNWGREIYNNCMKKLDEYLKTVQ